MSGSRVCKWSEKKDKGREPKGSMHLRDEKLSERLSEMHSRDENLHKRRSSCRKQLLVRRKAVAGELRVE